MCSKMATSGSSGFMQGAEDTDVLSVSSEGDDPDIIAEGLGADLGASVFYRSPDGEFRPNPQQRVLKMKPDDYFDLLVFGVPLILISIIQCLSEVFEAPLL